MTNAYDCTYELDKYASHCFEVLRQNMVDRVLKKNMQSVLLESVLLGIRNVSIRVRAKLCHVTPNRAEPCQKIAGGNRAEPCRVLSAS